MTATGVWVVGQFDWNWLVESIHATLEDATIAAESYQEVKFWEFGAERAVTAFEAKEQGLI